MSIVNSDGKRISYECSELIEELKLDMRYYGGNKEIAVWCKETLGVTLYTNYDFDVDKIPVFSSKLREGESIKKMTISELLPLLEKQNAII